MAVTPAMWYTRRKPRCQAIRGSRRVYMSTYKANFQLMTSVSLFELRRP